MREKLFNIFYIYNSIYFNFAFTSDNCACARACVCKNILFICKEMYINDILSQTKNNKNLNLFLFLLVNTDIDNVTNIIN